MALDRFPRPAAGAQLGGGTFNPVRGGTSSSLAGGAGFNPLAAGDRRYGLGTQTAPNQGPVNNLGGYAARDTRLAAARGALQRLVGRL